MVMANAGLNKNREELEEVGRTTSFVNSLIASLKGCGTPANPTLFGPLRN